MTWHEFRENRDAQKKFAGFVAVMAGGVFWLFVGVPRGMLSKVLARGAEQENRRAVDSGSEPVQQPVNNVPEAGHGSRAVNAEPTERTGSPPPAPAAPADPSAYAAPDAPVDAVAPSARVVPAAPVAVVPTVPRVVVAPNPAPQVLWTARGRVIINRGPVPGGVVAPFRPSVMVPVNPASRWPARPPVFVSRSPAPPMAWQGRSAMPPPRRPAYAPPPQQQRVARPNSGPRGGGPARRW
jgi:hypothetical protein